MNAPSRPYEMPQLVNEDGSPFLLEDLEPLQHFVHADNNLSVNEGGIMDENNNNNNNNSTTMDDSEASIETLLNQYRHLQQSASSYMQTCHTVFSRLQLKRKHMERHEHSLRRRAEIIAASSSTPTVKLNIGGVRFHVHRDTLLQFSMSIFNLLEGDEFMVQKDELGYVFLDRDPWLFRELLFLLRERRQQSLEAGKISPHLSSDNLEHRRITQLSPVERKRLMNEARYYGLNELVTELMTKRLQWQQCEFIPSSFRRYMATVLDSREESSSASPLEGCCFATCVSAENEIYLFGGCAEHEVVLNLFYQFHVERDDAEECREYYEEEEEKKDENTSIGNNDHNCNNNYYYNHPPAMRKSRITYNLIRPSSSSPFPSPLSLSDGELVPCPRSGHAMVMLHGRYILLFYGNDLHSHLNDVWFYHTTKNVWTRVKVRGAAVEARSGHSVTIIKDRLYLFGGKKLFGMNRHLFAEVFEGRFDVNKVELMWSLVSCPRESQSQLHPREGRGGGSLYLPERRASGRSTAITTNEEEEEEEEVQREGEEEEEGLCSVLPMAYHSAVDYKERYVIVFGGARAPADSQVSGGSHSNNNNNNTGESRWNNLSAASSPVGGTTLRLYQFDTLKYTWRCLHTSVNSPGLHCSDIPRSGHIALRCHDDMYVMGSYKEQRNLVLFQLSLTSLVWRQIQTTVAPMQSPPCGRAMPSGVLLTSTANRPYPIIFLFGGYNVTSRQYLNDAYILTL